MKKKRKDIHIQLKTLCTIKEDFIGLLKEVYFKATERAHTELRKQAHK